MTAELLHLEDLDRFANGKMPAQEAADFRIRLATDHALKAEFELYKSLTSGIKTFHRKRLLKQMGRFEDKFQQSAIPFYQKTSVRQLSIAASMVVLLGAGVFLWNNQRKKGNWQDAFIDDPGLPVLMSSRKDAYNQAMNFYRQGSYQEALNALPAKTSDTANYYRGIFWLKLQKPETAFRYLSPVSKQSTSAFKQKAEYYSAMALWQNGRKTEAKTAFEAIAKNQDHPFHDISVEILANSF